MLLHSQKKSSKIVKSAGSKLLENSCDWKRVSFSRKKLNFELRFVNFSMFDLKMAYDKNSVFKSKSNTVARKSL